MKPNQFLVAIVSAAAITGGTLTYFIGSADACPFSGTRNSFPRLDNSPPDSSNSANLAKTLGLSAILGSLIVGGVYWFRRDQKDKNTTDNQAETYQALEFPPSLPEVEQSEPEQLVIHK
ncbi:hypothetical protein [Iningainema tapete]|uniref:Transmembrane protein n=1 Tax=Iningainema tapete BLCC-T55 TaxID=2748662 RepID=A0A8J6XF02_9CYAN|nr:hypothetical protein [Iningainema tapete]MBD2774399.1 hypothetical protein [Iningainema tapete BLCC-T55]